MSAQHEAVPPDEESLGHTVDAPIDGRSAVSVGSDRIIGIAELIEEGDGIRLLILEVDAEEPDAGPRFQFDQQRMLVPAGDAPAREDVDHADLSDQVSPPQARHA
eukprot:GHVR01158969.1.p3 GENE.GHVR01158969.1~~GHVR01158969.1.p3  ORF type:complete len:105 (-),score=15.20 GHVR01158969.1:285-599(-)